MQIKDRRLLMGAAGVVVAIIALRYLARIPGWFKQRREERQWTVVNNLTPDRLLARCGQPLADDTRNLYPMVARDIRYLATGGQTIVFKFSRTSEQDSEWHFTSMQDASSGVRYETPAAKITALSCLDSSK
jgi:hypothetical protein